MAIFSCLSQLSHLPPNSKYILLTDSLSSLYLIADPYSTYPLIQRIHLILTTLSSLNSDIILIWIPGHVDFPPHDDVDAAAKQALSYPVITDKSKIPASDYRNHYRSLILYLNGGKLFGRTNMVTSFSPSKNPPPRGPLLTDPQDEKKLYSLAWELATLALLTSTSSLPISFHPHLAHTATMTISQYNTSSLVPFSNPSAYRFKSLQLFHKHLEITQTLSLLPSNTYISPNFSLSCNPFFLRRVNDPRGFMAR